MFLGALNVITHTDHGDHCDWDYSTLLVEQFTDVVKEVSKLGEACSGAQNLISEDSFEEALNLAI